MAERDDRDLGAVLAVAQRVNEADDLDGFVDALLDGLVALIPCMLATYNELTAGTHFLSVARPADFAYPPDVYERFASLRHEHPVLEHHARTGDGSATRISDLLDHHVYRRTDLYRQLYGPMGVEHQVVFELPSPRAMRIVIALARADRDFSDEECRLIETLRPHLAATYRHLRRATVLARQLELLTGASGTTRTTVHRGPEGTLSAGDAEGERVLARWLAPGTALRQALDDWLSAPAGIDSLPPATLRITGATGSLLIQAEIDDDGAGSLLLEEQVIDPDALRPLGLTARQAEVLARVVEGGTNASIASALGIRPATVKKLLEQIYTALDVHDRRSAIAAAVEVLPS